MTREALRSMCSQLKGLFLGLAVAGLSAVHSGCVTTARWANQESGGADLSKEACSATELDSDPDYIERIEKLFVTAIQKGEQVYIQDTRRRCAAIFDEGSPRECGIETSSELVLEKDGRIADRTELNSESCAPPPTLQYFKNRTFETVGLDFKQNRILLRQEFNSDLSEGAKESDYHRIRTFAIDRKSMKLIEDSPHR